MSRWGPPRPELSPMDKFDSPSSYYQFWVKLVDLDANSYKAMMEAMDGEYQLHSVGDRQYQLKSTDDSKFNAASLKQRVRLSFGGLHFDSYVVRYLCNAYI